MARFGLEWPLDLDIVVKGFRQVVSVLAWSWAVFIFILGYFSQGHYNHINNHQELGPPPIFQSIFIPVLKVLVVAPSALGLPTTTSDSDASPGSAGHHGSVQSGQFLITNNENYGLEIAPYKSQESNSNDDDVDVEGENIRYFNRKLQPQLQPLPKPEQLAQQQQQQPQGQQQSWAVPVPLSQAQQWQFCAGCTPFTQQQQQQRQQPQPQSKSTGFGYNLLNNNFNMQQQQQQQQRPQYQFSPQSQSPSPLLIQLRQPGAGFSQWPFVQQQQQPQMQQPQEPFRQHWSNIPKYNQEKQVQFNQDPAIAQNLQMNDDGRYSFSYNTPDQSSRQEQRGVDGTVSGSYGYTDPTGQQIQVEYRASPNQGFRAFGPSIPLQEPIHQQLPQAPQDTPEVQAARAQFFAAYEQQLQRIQQEAKARGAQLVGITPSNQNQNQQQNTQNGDAEVITAYSDNAGSSSQQNSGEEDPSKNPEDGSNPTKNLASASDFKNLPEPIAVPDSNGLTHQEVEDEDDELDNDAVVIQRDDAEPSSVPQAVGLPQNQNSPPAVAVSQPNPAYQFSVVFGPQNGQNQKFSQPQYQQGQNQQNGFNYYPNQANQFQNQNQQFAEQNQNQQAIAVPVGQGGQYQQGQYQQHYQPMGQSGQSGQYPPITQQGQNQQPFVVHAGQQEQGQNQNQGQYQPIQIQPGQIQFSQMLGNTQSQSQHQGYPFPPSMGQDQGQGQNVQQSQSPSSNTNQQQVPSTVFIHPLPAFFQVQTGQPQSQNQNQPQQQFTQGQGQGQQGPFSPTGAAFQLSHVVGADIQNQNQNQMQPQTISISAPLPENSVDGQQNDVKVKTENENGKPQEIQDSNLPKGLPGYFYYVSVGGQPHYVSTSSDPNFRSTLPTSLKAHLLGAIPLAAVHDNQVPNRQQNQNQIQNQNSGQSQSPPVYLEMNPPTAAEVQSNVNIVSTSTAGVAPANPPRGQVYVSFVPAAFANGGNAMTQQQLQIQNFQGYQTPLGTQTPAHTVYNGQIPPVTFPQLYVINK